MANNPKMVMCRNCGTTIAAGSRNCPACGAKNKKPFYKRGWFIFLVILVIISIISSINRKSAERAEKKNEYRWPDSGLASMIPKPDSSYGRISSDSERIFGIDIYEIKKKQYEDYVDTCKERGFTVDYNSRDSYYSAENEAGYSLTLRYDEKGKELGIFLYAPDEQEDEAGHENGAEAEGNASNVQEGQEPGRGQELKGEEEEQEPGQGQKPKGEEGQETDQDSDSKGEEQEANQGQEPKGEDEEQVANQGQESKGEEQEANQSQESKGEEEGQVPNQGQKPNGEEGTSAGAEGSESQGGSNAEALVDGMRPEFKEAMDSYEEFYDEYCEFMTQYLDNPSDTALLKDYLQFLSKAQEVDEKFAAWDGDMNNAEMAYYTKVHMRISQKLLEVSAGQ